MSEKKIRIEFTEFEKLVSEQKGLATRNKFAVGDIWYKINYYGFNITKIRIIQIIPQDIMPKTRYHSGKEVYAIVETFDMAFESVSNGINLMNLGDGYFMKEGSSELAKAKGLWARHRILEKEAESLASSLYDDSARQELYQKYDVYSKYD